MGLVHRRELLDAGKRRPDANSLVRDLLHPIRFVPETTPANELLEHFIADRSHMFAVVDEYGYFEGVVTLEDVLERLLGAEIVEERDQVEDMQRLALERSPQRRSAPSKASRESKGTPFDSDSRVSNQKGPSRARKTRTVEIPLLVSRPRSPQ